MSLIGVDWDFDGDKIDWDFEYHAPTGDKVDQHEQVRAACKVLAKHVDGAMLDCREKSVAITHIENAMFWANAGIARNPRPEGS